MTNYRNQSYNLRNYALAMVIVLATLLSAPPMAVASEVDLHDGASVTSGPAAVRSKWQWPTLTPVAVNRAFDPPALPWLSGHRGVDLGAPMGSTIAAPADEIVVFSGNIIVFCIPNPLLFSNRFYIFQLILSTYFFTTQNILANCKKMRES